MLTNSDFPRNFSALATKPLTILLSIGVHYVVASNLGIFGLPPLKPKPFGGTVKVVDLTPAERTRVPEVVRATPVPIVTPSPVIRNFPQFSAPLTQPSSIPAPAKSPAATVPQTSSSGSKPNQNSKSPRQPKSGATKPGKPRNSKYSFDKKNRFDGVSPGQSSSEEQDDSGTLPNESSSRSTKNNQDQRRDAQPSKSPKPSPSPPDKDENLFSQRHDEQKKRLIESFKKDNQQVVLQDVKPRNSNMFNASPISCDRDKERFFRTTRIYENDNDLPSTTLRPDPKEIEKLNEPQRIRIISETDSLISSAHKGKGVKGKVFFYTVSFKIGC
jgi:hypothetical protein